MQPDYYKEFTCIADQCSFTCCREWKIGVDDVTFKKWKYTCIPDGMYEESLIRQNVADCSNGGNRESGSVFLRFFSRKRPGAIKQAIHRTGPE